MKMGFASEGQGQGRHFRTFWCITKPVFRETNRKGDPDVKMRKNWMSEERILLQWILLCLPIFLMISKIENVVLKIFFLFSCDYLFWTLYWNKLLTFLLRFSICKKWDKFERIEYVQYADWSTFSGLQFFSTERRKEGWYQQKFGKLAAHYDPREPRGCNLQNLPLRPIGEHLGKTSLNKNITIKVIIDLRNLSLISAHGIGICLLNTQLKIQNMSKSHQSIWVARGCFTLTHLPKITRQQARRSEDDFSYTQLCSLIIDRARCLLFFRK